MSGERLTPTAREVLVGALRDTYRSLVALGSCNVLVTVAALVALSVSWVHPLLAPPAAIVLVGLAIDLLCCASIVAVERGRVDLSLLRWTARDVRWRRALVGGAAVVLAPLVGAQALFTYLRMGSPLGLGLAAASVWLVAFVLATAFVAWPGAVAAARAGTPVGVRDAVRASMVVFARAGLATFGTLAGVAVVLAIAGSLVVPLAACGVAFATLAAARLVAAPVDAPVADRYDLAA